MLLPGTVVLHKASSAVVLTVQGYAQCLEALNKAQERSEEGRFHRPLGVGFIASVLVIPRIKMKHPASVLPLRLVSPQKGRLYQNPQ